jgi:hypothetical protein
MRLVCFDCDDSAGPSIFGNYLPSVWGNLIRPKANLDLDHLFPVFSYACFWFEFDGHDIPRFFELD